MSKPIACYIPWSPTKILVKRWRLDVVFEIPRVWWTRNVRWCAFYTNEPQKLAIASARSLHSRNFKHNIETSSFHQTFSWTPSNLFRHYSNVRFRTPLTLTVFDPDIPGTPIYRANPFPPSILVNRGPTVMLTIWERFELPDKKF